MTIQTAKKIPSVIESPGISLINLDPAAAARSIDMLVAQATDEWDWVSEKVVIQFYNLEQPGQEAFFCLGGCLCPKSITLQHGEVTTLTRGEVRFIESRQTPIWEYKANGTGKMKKERVGWKPRYQCRSVNQRPAK